MTKNRPHYQAQGPADNCVINGRELGWLSCSAYGMAMLIDASTFGADYPSGCTVRRHTGDTAGGLTIRQVAAVARDHYGVTIEVRTGSNVCTPQYAARQLRAGRKAVVQGSTRPTLSTTWRSTSSPVNHLVEVNEVRGGTLYEPDEALVYDPAADNRYPWVDQGPSWWPWWLVKQFASALQPYGEDDRRIVGIGHMYAGFGPAPHVNFAWKGTRTTPFPDRQRINVPRGKLANVRSRPTSMSPSYIVDRRADGTLFEAYQVTHGIRPAGSTSDRWYGDQTGRQWVHASNLIAKGGGE